MKPITCPSITLRPSGNLLGSVKFYSLNTGVVLRRKKFTPISTPKIPVISNVNVEAHTDADSIRATLAKQVSFC